MRLCDRFTGLSVLVAAILLTTPALAAWPGPDDDRSYRAGIGLLNKGLNDLAVSEFRRYLSDHPDGSEATNARYSLAVCLTRLQRHAEASKELESVIRAAGFEFAPDALLLQAQCCLAAGDDAAAASVLKEAMDRYPGFNQADRVAAMLGESLYRLGKFKESADVLATLLSKWPQSPVAERAGLFEAMALTDAGNFKAAAERSAALRARFPKGEYAASAALMEATCRQQLGETEVAARLFQAAGAGTGTIRLQALLGLAALARSQGDLTRCEKALADAAVEPNPMGLRELVSLERGKLLFQQGNFKGAQAAFSEAKKTETDTVKAEAAYWFAKCQIKQGKIEEAASNLEQAAERFSASDLVPDMLFERAAALSNLGDEGALEAWAQWKRRFPGNELTPDALIAEAWCAHRAGKFSDCEDLCTTLAAQYPNKASSENAELLLAENAFASQEFEVALVRYSLFIDHHSKSQYAWRGAVRRALCLSSLGRAAEAASVLEAALAVGGDQESQLRRVAISTLADQAFSQADWASAERWFERLAAEKGTREAVLDARLRQGICIERQGRFNDCLPVFDKVVSEGAESAQVVQAQFERGQALLELGRLDEAKEALDHVVNAKVDTAHLKPYAMRHLATIASRQGRHEDAAELLLAARGENGGPGGGSALELGSALLAAGKYEQAERTFTATIEGEPKSAAALKAGVLRGIAISRLGRYEEALGELQQGIASADLDAETRASGQYEIALTLRGLGREAEAATSLRAVIESAPARLGCYAGLELAQIEIKAKEHEQALKRLDKCIADSGKLNQADAALINERATYLRAACLLQLGKANEAADSLKTFAETHPESRFLPSVHLIRGEALLASGRAREAADELGEATKAGDVPEVQSSALLRIGDAWAGCQDWARSDQAFTAFLDRFPQSPLWFQAKFGQGWARENQGRHESAIEAYRGVVAQHDGPTAARAQFQIGECLYAQKQYEAAVAELLKTDVLFSVPEWSAAALYEAGRCLAEMNRPQDSIKQFDDLIKRFPDTRWAKLATEKREASAPAPISGQRTPTASQAR